MQRTRKLAFESMEGRRLLAAVDIPDNLTGQAAAVVASPVNIDNAAGVRGVSLRLRYDPTLLQLDTSNVKLGSLFANDPTAQITVNLDAGAGTVTVFISAANPLGNVGGGLAEFDFVVQAGATVGATTTLDLTELRLNEGAIEVTPVPQVGADPTDGRITIVAGPSGDGVISGFVYSDVNLNFTPDPTEGLPGVTITLINTATNELRQTTTQDNGQYRFTGLAPGEYRVVETQPAAFVDGGNNEITATLTAGQDLGDQNFREIGLRPEYVYNRLFATVVMPVGSTPWTATIRQIIADAESKVAGTVTSSAVTTLTALAETAGPSAATTREDSAGADDAPPALFSLTSFLASSNSDAETADSPSEPLYIPSNEDTLSSEPVLPEDSDSAETDEGIGALTTEEEQAADEVFATTDEW